MKKNILLFISLGLISFLTLGCEKENTDCNPKLKEDCICTAQYDPVCGCDGVTYGNACNAACNGVSSTPGECILNYKNLLGEWQFLGYKEKDNVSDNKVKHKYQITLTLDNEKKVSGKSAINFYNGTYMVKSGNSKTGTVNVEGFLSTKIGGTPEDLKYETNYLDNLTAITKYEIVGSEKLLLTFDIGDYKDQLVYLRIK